LTVETASIAESYTPGERVMILITVSACTALYALTLTVVNVVLPQLQGALSATPDQVAWIVTLNIVATAVVTPATGWLVSRFGQRKVMIWAVAGFAVSTFMCSTADTLAPLLVYRVFQGGFGAPTVPLAQAILLASYPKDQRAMAQGFFGMAVVLGPALGPVLGGYLAEEYDWRWVFLIIVPMSVLALVFVLFVIRDGGREEKPRLDWTGFLTLSIALTALQLIMDRGERLDWLESGEILSLILLMCVSFYMFVAHTATHRNPFISPQLFLDRNYSIGLLVVFVYGMLNFTPIVLLPPLLQNLKGYPDSLIGLLLAMRGAGLVIGFFVAGRMGRLDPRIGLVLGLGLVGMSGVVMSTFDLNVPSREVAWTGIMQGVGCGMMWVPLTVVTFATLPERLLPQGSAIFHLLRNFGSSIFISISVMLVTRTAKVNYADMTEFVSPFNETLRFPGVLGGWNPETIRGLAAIGGEIERQARMIGYSNAFLLYTVVCFAIVPTLFLIRVKHKS
jgi:DHA2 family multidrug resistance protein